MIKDTKYELILGSKKDPIFGSTVMFGRGGTDVEFFKDTTIGFPPLNQTLARLLMEETDIFNLIKQDEDSEELINSFERHLVSLSQLIIDFPEITELDVNPISFTDDGFQALDALIRIDKDLALEEPDPEDFLVIKPYPREYIEEWELNDGTPVTIRPIRPEDEPLEFELFDTLSKQSWRYRFFGPVKEMNHDDMVRYTNIDYRREMALVGIIREEGERKMIGVGRLIVNPDKNDGEFAVLVGDPWQERGLGEKLTDSIIGVAEDKGLESIWATMMKNNKAMIHLAKKLGFEVEEESSDTMRAILRLR